MVAMGISQPFGLSLSAVHLAKTLQPKFQALNMQLSNFLYKQYCEIAISIKFLHSNQESGQFLQQMGQEHAAMLAMKARKTLLEESNSSLINPPDKFLILAMVNLQSVALEPQAQSSEEAREKVENEGGGDITSADVQHSHRSAAEGTGEEQTGPNVDYLRQKDYLMMYPRYEKDYMEKISPKHQEPKQVLWMRPFKCLHHLMPY